MGLAFSAGAVLVTQLPILIVLIGAVIIAIARQNRYPQISTLVIIFSLVEFLLIVAGTPLQVMLPTLMAQQGETNTAIVTTLTLVSIARSLVGAVTLALLLWATFGWRSDVARDSL